MTEKQTIEHIILTGKSPLTFDDYMNYGFFIGPIGFVVIGISMGYNYFTFEPDIKIILVAILLISVGVAFGFFTLKRFNDNLTFISIPVEDDIDDIAEGITQHFKVSKMEINRKLDRIILWTKTTAFSWGEMKTLLLIENKI